MSKECSDGLPFIPEKVTFDIDANGILHVGAKDKAEVLEMGVHVGSVITFQDELFKLNDVFYCGRALDNRMGGFCIAEVARMLKEKKKKLPFSLYIVNAVQEEI